MIYAIEAVGTGFIKFGRATSVGKRLKELEVGCPHELHILAIAEWPDHTEPGIHRFLQASHERGEWFRASDDTALLIQCFNDREAGLTRFQFELSKRTRNTDWRDIAKDSKMALRAAREAARAELASWRAERQDKKQERAQRLTSRTRETEAKIERRRAARAAWWRENGLALAVEQQTLDPVKNQYQDSADSSVIP